MKQTRQTIANAYARKFGHGKATEIMLGERTEIIESIRTGYRKRTTGAYVPQAYVRKAWKSCYYQHLVCKVALSKEDWNRGMESELIKQIKGE